MRGIALAELPEAARERLVELEAGRMQAEDAMRGFAQRTASLPTDRTELLAWLESERAKQSQKHGVLHQLHNRVQQWLTQLPAGSALEEAPPPVMEHKANGDLNAAIVSVRAEIARLRVELQSTRMASLPKADQKKLAEDYVVGLMRQAAPNVAIVGDRLRVAFRGDCVAAEDTAALLAWVAPDTFLRALERAIDAVPERADALPVDQRKQRVGELEAALDQAERAEQVLLHQAHESGIDILPRADVSPAAYLGVVVVNAAKAAA
jgi:hypothetical protein